MGQNRVIRGQCRDHPRIRGTNAFFSAIAWIVSGSSPHTRDKFENTALLIVAGGIIPAYAGQIALSLKGITYLEDHPRIRGTNLIMAVYQYAEQGSSPHTRDKSLIALFSFHPTGIIPAYAGQIMRI